MECQRNIWQIFQGDVFIFFHKKHVLFWSKGREMQCRPKFITHPFFMPLLNDSFIHSFTQSFVRSFVHSFIRLFVHSFVHSFVYSFIHSFIHFILSFFHFSFISLISFISFIPSIHLIHFIHFSFVHSFARSFVRSFFHSFIYSLIHGGVHSLCTHSVICHAFVWKHVFSSKHFFHPLLLCVLVHPLVPHSFAHSSTHPRMHMCTHSFVLTSLSIMSGFVCSSRFTWRTANIADMLRISLEVWNFKKKRKNAQNRLPSWGGHGQQRWPWEGRVFKLSLWQRNSPKTRPRRLQWHGTICHILVTFVTGSSNSKFKA